MRRGYTLIIVAFVVILSAARLDSDAQEPESRVAHSNGSGTLKVGDEELKISAVVLKLFSDRTAEVTIVADLTIFLNATWSPHAESRHDFDLEITRGGLEGNGRVVLSDDGKTVTRLNLSGISRATKRRVEASFEGKAKKD